MKILGISFGTKNGNNDTMCRVALEECQKLGAEIEFIHAFDWDLQTCTGCVACSRGLVMGKGMICTRKDDYKDLYEKMVEADGVLVVEGLHGLNSRISGSFGDKCSKVFIMPYGNVYCDTKLMDSNEIRMLRRIVRDNRHRSAHALATIDYWPMISKSEEKYYTDYLTCADYHVNSFLAPLALNDIQAALKQVEKGTIAPSVFMEKSTSGKPFADLSSALAKASKLIGHLDKIPVVSPDQVPAESILNEFISG